MFIKCAYCGSKIPKESNSCIQCGGPIAFAFVSDEKNNEPIYSLAIVSYKNDIKQLAVSLKEILYIEYDEVLRKLNSMPSFLFKDLKETKALTIKEKLDLLPIEYNLYKDGVLFKRRTLESEDIVEEVTQEQDLIYNLELDTPEQIAEKSELQKRKKIIRYTLIAFFTFLLFISMNIYFQARAKEEEKESKAYYDSLEFILNPEDFYGLTRNDIQAIYGYPYKIDLNDTERTYAKNDYELSFYFKNGTIETILYNPKDKFKYRNSPQDIFYLFGLQDNLNQFYTSDSFADSYIDYRHTGQILKNILLCDNNYAEKTIDNVFIEIKNEMPKRKVFEADFTNVKQYYNLVSYLGNDIRNVIQALVQVYSSDSTRNINYKTDLGVIRFTFDSNFKITAVSIELDEPMKYESSPQEAMVMFGINPKTEGIELSAFDEYLGYESYNKVYHYDDSARIDGIDKVNKTFTGITFFD